MREITCNRGQFPLKALGIITLVFLMLVGIAGATPYAYIPNHGDNTVSVIDTVTNTVTATIEDAGISLYGVAVIPDGTKVYVTNAEPYASENGNISVIDTATNTITAKVPVGRYPFGVAVNPAGTEVYVANAKDDTVSVIDTATDTVTATVSVGDNPWGIAVNPTGTKVYVTNGLSNTVSVIDTASNTVTATVNVGSMPAGAVVTPDGTKVYVTNLYSSCIFVIDTATNTVITTVSVGAKPFGVAVNPTGTQIYVTNADSNTVSIIDTATNTVIATVSVGNYPYGIAVTPDGSYVYVTNVNDDTVSIIDTATNYVTNTVNVGRYPCAFGQFIISLSAPEPVLPAADFSTNLTSGYAPLSVQFTDLSANVTDWIWDFGDGTVSVEQNPVHTYSVAGTYTVILTVSNSNGTDSKLATMTVLEQVLSPVADFSASTLGGKAPLTVTFTDESAGSPTSWLWDFGDKSISTAQNPVHTYSKTGKYTVSLTVENTAGSNTKKISKYIIVKNNLKE